MGSKVLLVNSNRCVIPDPVFPLGLSHVNGALRRAGHQTQWLDLLADPQPLEEALRLFQPDFVGVSLRNIDNVLIRKQEVFFGELSAIRATVRRVRPCPLIMGGSGYSIYPTELLELSQADFGIRGDGETSLVALLAALQTGADYTGIPGLVYRRGGAIAINQEAPSALDEPLGSLDLPASVAAYYLKASGMMNVQTQRGCGHTCCYCTYPLIEGRAPRRRPPEAVAEEMAQLQARGAQYAFVVDSVFNSSAQHVIETCEAILRRRLTLRWSCFLRPQGLTWELMQLLKRAGLAHIEFGSDSFCDTVLEECGKRLSFGEILESNQLARRAGIDACHFLICGGPGETPETLETTFANSQLLEGAVFMAVVGMRVYPGTPLARRAVRDGRIRADANLLAPVYYLAPGLSEEGVFARLREVARRSPNWIPGDPAPGYERLVTRLRGRGIVGPLWSYFAMLQRIMPQGAAAGS